MPLYSCGNELRVERSLDKWAGFGVTGLNGSTQGRTKRIIKNIENSFR